MKIRPFTPTDESYQAIIEIIQSIDPDEHPTVDTIRQSDESRAKRQTFKRYLGEAEGQIVTHGSWRQDEGDSYQFSFFIKPALQQSQMPKRMHDHLMAEMMAQNPKAIVSEPREDETYRIKQLEADGFELKMRFPRSHLNVQRFDSSPYQQHREKLEAEGIRFVTLSDVMKSDSEWQRNVWRMFNIIDQDVPYPDEQTAVPFETYAKYYEGDTFRPDSWAIAIDSNLEGAEQYVGMSVVNLVPTRPTALFAGITGTIPSHRRRKIATILKVCSAEYTKSQGVEWIETDNEEHNPMYQLNLDLGFEPLPAWVYYKKEIA